MSDNMFQEVLQDPKAAQEKYIGPDYPYYKYIKTPSQIGMSSEGSLNALGKDITGVSKLCRIVSVWKGEGVSDRKTFRK